jgi:hypothetical protein
MAITYNTTIDQGADWYINFIYNQPALITNITGDGSTVTFTANNGFVAGQTVSISGVLPNQYNFQNVEVDTANTEAFTVSNPATGVYISGGMAYAPVNITGDTAELQLRSLPNDPTAVLTLSTDNNGIAITGLTGEIAVHATADQTRVINEGYYYYDLELTQAVSGIVTRIAQGQILVSAEITR